MLQSVFSPVPERIRVSEGQDLKSMASPGPERHLLVLRDQLRRDYLTGTNWDDALRDLAQMTCEALGAREALVALFSEEQGAWSAFTSGGQRLEGEQISEQASRSVLEYVRLERTPFVSTSQSPMSLSTRSMITHGLQSVLAVPIYWWDVQGQRRERRFGGCLYAHRTWTDAPFTDQDMELVLDITEIAQRTLNVLRVLRAVETDLAVSKERIRGLEARTGQYRLGTYESADPWFAENVLGVLQRAARHDRVGLLLLGPTGSGKSHLAQAFHLEGPRKSGPFLMLDCSQVTSDESLAAELFGYSARSGFANAPERGRSGMAALAHRGTLFIEEIGVLPPTLQQRLLTLIEMGVYSPLGSSERLQVDLQVIAATNEDLPRLVREGRFREDLFWRIGEVTVQLPSLSEREADIPALAETFLGSACRRFGRRNLEGFTPQAMEVLIRHDWAQGGNIRGLQQTIHRSVLLLAPEAQRLDAPDLRFTEPLGRGRAPAAERQAEKPSVPTPDLEAILEAIRKHGSGTAAARSLGISRGVLVWQLRKAGLTIGEAF
jgi:DNA-binding NtrC family response regulator